MSPIENRSSPTAHAPQRAADIAELVDTTITGALATLQRESRATLGSPLRRQCLAVVERLWQRRDAVALALALPPRRCAAAGEPARGIKHGTPVAEQTVELDMALSNSARILYDAAEGEWRELQLEARQRAVAGDCAPPQAPWPPAPNIFAAGLRWAVERASDEHTVRLELMRLGTQLLVPRFIALCRRQLAGGPQAPAGAAPAPARPEPLAPARQSAALIERVQPGEWFRMYLHDQWATARLTWRSENGHFFMFSSRLAGRSHSLSRSALERMIARGQFEPLARRPAAGRGAAGAA